MRQKNHIAATSTSPSPFRKHCKMRTLFLRGATMSPALVSEGHSNMIENTAGRSFEHNSKRFGIGYSVSQIKLNWNESAVGYPICVFTSTSARNVFHIPFELIIFEFSQMDFLSIDLGSKPWTVGVSHTKCMYKTWCGSCRGRGTHRRCISKMMRLLN